MPSSSSLGYDLADILSALIEPVLRMCRLSTEGLDPSDAAVLMLNNTAVLQVGSPCRPDPLALLWPCVAVGPRQQGCSL